MPLSYSSQLGIIPTIVLNGDSLTLGTGSTTVAGRWPNRLAGLRPPLSMHNYAVGGASVVDVRDAVSNMSAADKALTNFVCFGMPDRNTSAEYIDAANVAMSALNNQRVIICTPVTGDYAQFYPGGAAYAGRVEAGEYILSSFPENAFDLFQWLMDGSDGSPGDLVDVANGITPRSLRVDDVHWNDIGQAWVAFGVGQFWQSRNWAVVP